MFFGLLLVFGEPTEVEFHLAFVFGLEVAEFKVNGDEPPEVAVIEKEIEIEVVGIDLNAFLAGKEGEAVAEFEQEGFNLAEDRVFEVLFEIAVVKAEEVEDVGILEDKGGRELVLAAKLGELGFGNSLRLSGNGGALIEHGADLLTKGADTPTLDPAHLGVEVPLECVFEGDDLFEMGPPQLSRQRSDNLAF